MEKGFAKYLADNVSFYEMLSQEELNEVKRYYDAVCSRQKIVDNTFDMAFNHNLSGIDYSTDLQKNNDELYRARKELEVVVEKLKDKYGYDSEEISPSRQR